uniref:Ig-like domain-containing protein n=1 Tax=Macrostomum lignano TaxID=282301 RepID=A0A1I8F8K4_9PLAT
TPTRAILGTLSSHHLQLPSATVAEGSQLGLTAGALAATARTELSWLRLRRGVDSARGRRWPDDAANWSAPTTKLGAFEIRLADGGVEWTVARVLSATPSPSASKSDSGSYACVAETSLLGGELRRARQLFYLDVLPARAVNQTVAWRVCGVNSATPISVASAVEGSRLAIDCSVSANIRRRLRGQWRLSGSALTATRPAAGAAAGAGGGATPGCGSARPASSAATTAGAGGDAGQPMRREFSARASVDIIVEYRLGPPEIRATAGSPVLAGHPASLVCQPSTTDPGVPVPEFSGPATPATAAPRCPWPGRRFCSSARPDCPTVAGTICTPENKRRPGIFRCAGGCAVADLVDYVGVADGADCQRLHSGGGAAAAAGCAPGLLNSGKAGALTRWFKNGVEIRQGDAAATTAIEEGYDRGQPRRHSSQPFPRPHSVSLECLVDAQPEPTVTWELLAGTGGADRQQFGWQSDTGVATVVSLPGTLPGVKRDGPVRLPARNRLGESSHVIQAGLHDRLRTSAKPDDILLASSSTMSGAEVTRVGDCPSKRDGAAARGPHTLSRCWPSTTLAAAGGAPSHGRSTVTSTPRELQLPGVGGVRAETPALRLLRFVTRRRDGLLRSGCEVSGRRRHRVESLPQLRASERLTAISFVNSYRLSACLC